MRFLSKKEMYAIDQYTIEKIGIADETLMENAAQSIVRELQKQIHIHEPILVAAGAGNNGGDGIAAARILKNLGFKKVDLWIIPPPQTYRGAAKTHLHIFENCGYSYTSYSTHEQQFKDALTDAKYVIDALFGIGFRNPLSPPYRRIIEQINACTATVFSIDIPSGIEADTDNVDTAVKANKTYPIQFPKISASLPQVNHYYGEWEIIDIGIPPKALEILSK